jgi:multidrug efflux pump subunit AcrA (membrane-fusion protein)
MLNNLTANALRELTVSQRRELILQRATSVPAIQIADQDLQTAYQISQVLSPVICSYIQAQIELDYQNGSILEADRQSEAIQAEVEKFVADFNKWLRGRLEVQNAAVEKAPTNLYELAGAKRLASSNAVTRHLSTRMGHLWERLARISPYAVSPELDFGVVIRGIDIIFCAKDQPVFAQLKS